LIDVAIFEALNPIIPCSVGKNQIKNPDSANYPGVMKFLYALKRIVYYYTLWKIDTLIVMLKFAPASVL